MNTTTSSNLVNNPSNTVDQQQQKQNQETNSEQKLKNEQETSEESNEEKNQRAKKRQVRRACVNCKRAHACCSDDRPCRRCQELGIESTCFDVEPKKRGRKRKRRPEEGMAAFQSNNNKRPALDSNFFMGSNSIGGQVQNNMLGTTNPVGSSEEVAKLRTENAWLRGLLAWTATGDGNSNVPTALQGVDIRGVLDGAGVGMLITTRGGGVVGWNKCLQEKLGFCAEDLRSGRVRSWMDMVHPEQWLAALREGVKCFSSQSDHWSLPSLSCVKRDGSIVPALCHTVIVRDPSNQVPLYAITHFFF